MQPTFTSPDSNLATSGRLPSEVLRPEIDLMRFSLFLSGIIHIRKANTDNRYGKQPWNILVGRYWVMFEEVSCCLIMPKGETYQLWLWPVDTEINISPYTSRKVEYPPPNTRHSTNPTHPNLQFCFSWRVRILGAIVSSQSRLACRCNRLTYTDMGQEGGSPSRYDSSQV